MLMSPRMLRIVLTLTSFAFGATFAAVMYLVIFKGWLLLTVYWANPKHYEWMSNHEWIGYVLFALSGVVAGFYWHKRFGQWYLEYFGANRDVKCPSCGTSLPVWRKPQTIYEFLWGGWTCARCGQKIDGSGGPRNR
jgi:hypothetical protein